MSTPRVRRGVGSGGAQVTVPKPKPKPKPMSKVSNSYHVPIRYWETWTPETQSAFNVAYGYSVLKQAVLSPAGVEMSARAWQTLCWNFLVTVMEDLNG